jgi:nitrite reductase (NO-forming)
MNKTYIIIVIVVLLALGGFYLFSNSNKLPAPVVNQETQQTPVQTPGQNGVGSAQTSTGQTKDFTVVAKNFSFTPNTITVKKGDKVKLTVENMDGFHNLKIDEFGVATSLLKSPAQETVEFIADKVGTFQYYCSVGNHRAMGMWGTLTVQE